MTEQKPTPTKAAALKALGKAQEALAKAEAKATDLATRRGEAALLAHKTGATYDEMAAAAKITPTRINQVLRRARKANQ